jgi:hypothetical protein
MKCKFFRVWWTTMELSLHYYCCLKHQEIYDPNYCDSCKFKEEKET